MKKLFTLCAAMMIVVSAAAKLEETFQFIDAQGNVVADGSTIVVNQLNREGQMVIPLSVKNVSGEKLAVGLYETISAMPGGTWQTCAFGSCMQLTEDGYSPKSVVPADFSSDIQTEWIPGDGNIDAWEATLQVHIFNIVSVTRFGQVIESPGNDIVAEGPKVTVRFEYKSDIQKCWWGYVSADEDIYGVGVQNAETYDCAAYFSGTDEIAAGKTIHAIRFALYSGNVRNVKVWISESLPDDISTDALQVANVSNPEKGINEVELPRPYVIGSKGVYVGYSFTITKVQYSNDAYPVCFAGAPRKDALYLRTSSSVTTWGDLYSNGFGCLYLQMLISGNFPYANAASIASNDLGEYVTYIGGTAQVSLPIRNEGTEPITSIDYSIATGSSTEYQEQITLDNPIAFGSTRNVTINISGDKDASIKEKRLTIINVNGNENEYKSATTVATISTVSQLVDRGIAVEQFTGTTCGWCPRGHAGMKKMREEFGDKFVGIAIHRYSGSSSSDAMYISTYNHVTFDGAPSCRIDRGPVIDPYYGSDNDILDDIRAELAIPAKVALDVKGQWNEDSTKVTATATIKSLLPGGTYKIEYVLIADSLCGTTSAWNQSNYYAQNYNQSSNLPADLAIYASGGIYGTSSIKGYVFNDVAIAVAKSTQTTAPGALTLDDTVTNSYTLSLPTNATLRKAIIKDKVAVAALIISSDGTIANAAKYYMSSKTPGVNGDVNGDDTVDVADISAVISVMAGTSVPGGNSDSADVNGDGTVDVADISAIISIMAGR